MPKCNTVLQSESDLFEPEIQPNSPGNCDFLAFIRTIKSSKCFRHCSVNPDSYNILYHYYSIRMYNFTIILAL